VVLGALGVYGWTFTSVFMSSSDKVRAQLQTGRMLIVTEDRVHCRSHTFDNETSQMTAGALTACENRPRIGAGSGAGGSFGVIRDSFNNR